MKPNILYISDFRIAISRCFGFSMFIALLFGRHLLIEDSTLENIMEGLGFSLIVVAVLGRLWSSFFICGKKNISLVSDGPYSLVRNPLYFFSFLGTLGIGLATGSMLLTVLLITFFVIIYSKSVNEEEAKLSDIFGESYQNYCKITPRFIPSFRNYHQPIEHVVDVKKFSRAFLDAMWFLWLFGLLQVIEGLHYYNFLPTFFSLP
jgi:protein-S-isoprenylcysteine O-methyltransferase Ste14